MSDSGTWKEYSKLVLSEIERMDGSVKGLTKEVSELRTELAVHDVKIGRSSSFYGAISGFIVAVVTGVVINFVISNSETSQPKVIYKDKSPKIEIENG